MGGMGGMPPSPLPPPPPPTMALDLITLISHKPWVPYSHKHCHQLNTCIYMENTPKLTLDLWPKSRDFTDMTLSQCARSRFDTMTLMHTVRLVHTCSLYSHFSEITKTLTKLKRLKKHNAWMKRRAWGSNERRHSTIIWNRFQDNSLYAKLELEP